MTEEHFIGQAIKDMVQHEVTILFNKRKNNSKHSANYFSVEKPTKPTFMINYFESELDFEIFLHEYCHFLQWKNNTKLWQRGIKSLNYFYDWLANKYKTCPKYHLINIQALELDADRRVVKLVKKHKLNIDIRKYIKESNAYVMTFLQVWKKRDYKQFPVNYNHPDILDLLPDNHLTKKSLTKDYTKLLELFDIHK